MRLRVSLALLAIIALLIFGWVHSEIRPSPSSPRLPSDARTSPENHDAESGARDGIVRASSPSNDEMKGDDFATRSHAKAIERGQGYLTARKWTDAIQAFDEALGFDPRDFEARYKLTAAYLGRRADGDLEKALVAAVASVTIDPTRVEGPYNIACANALLGNSNEAFAALARAYKVNARYVKRNAPTDDDLKSLRNFPDFERVLRGEDPASHDSH